MSSTNQDKKSKSLVMDKINNHTIYFRSFNPSQAKVTNLLSKCYDGKTSIILPSGTCAISAALHTVVTDFKEKEINIIYGNELYTDTPKVILQMENYVKCNFYKIPIHINKDVDHCFNSINKKIPTIIFIESCSNPSGFIPDFSLLLKHINSLRKLSKVAYMVDNTYLSSSVFNPFDIGADIVVLSLAKYYSGGNCIAGAAIGSEEFASKIQNWTKLNGLHVSPIHCDIISDNIVLMKDRTTKSNKMTRDVAEYCEKKGFVVSYPGLPSHGDHKRCVQFFKTKCPNSTFTILLNGKKEEVFKLIEKSDFELMTSFGGKESIFDSWPKNVKKSTQIRFSVGYEDTFEDIVKKLDKVLVK
jgi:cystathionine beta-lyase/cystathionine gamma-synthase